MIAPGAKTSSLGRAVLLATMMNLAMGCLELPPPGDAEPLACVRSSDCPADQVCLANQCYGDPPGGAFGVVVSPAASSTNAAQAAYPNVVIDADGALGTYELSNTYEFGGALRGLCDDCAEASFPALLTLSQRSAFVGGPASYQALPVDQAASGAFYFTVPRTSAPSQVASLSIAPLDAGEVPWAARLPQTRMIFGVPLATLPTVDGLVDGTSRRVLGHVTLPSGAPAVGFSVTVQGQFSEDRAPERISAAVVTDDDGEFVLPVSPLALPLAELVIAPTSPMIAPTYRQPLTLGLGDTLAEDLIVTPSPAQAVTIHAVGYASSGETIVPEAGRVIVEALFDAAPNSSPQTTAAFRAELAIDATAPEVLMLPTNASAYFLTVLHAGTGEIGSLYRKPVTFAQMSEEQILPRRTSVVGTLTSANGTPVAGATLTLVPSVGTVWNQIPALQALVVGQAAATTLTALDGSYVMWADTSWHDTGNWRLSIVPPEATPTPLPRWATVIELQASQPREIDIALPGATAASAIVTFPNARPAEGSRITLYRVNSINPCLTSAYPPPSCELPEVVVASGNADAEGKVLLVVPNTLPAL